MFSLLLDTSSALVSTLSIVAIVVLAIFAGVSLVASIWKYVLAARYVKFNKHQVSNGLTGAQTAEQLLKGLGIEDVRVVKCNLFSALFLGNSYSPFAKKIRLRKNIYNNSSLTAVALATQKVALAKMDKDGDKKIKTRSVLMTMGYFAPFAVLPLFLIGVLIDILAMNNLGLFTIIFTAIAVVWYLAAFIVVILNIPIEKKACNKAIEFIEKINLLNSEEIEDAKLLYQTYITSYVLDFVNQLLYYIWRILKLIIMLIPKK